MTAPSNGSGPVPPESDPSAAPVLRQVGPGGMLASDHAFGVALVTLWHRVALTGPAGGFPAGVDRGEVARRVPMMVDELRTGRAVGYAVNAGRLLVGAGILRPGHGSAAHTGTLPVLLTDPDHVHTGVGGRLLAALLDAASDAGIDRVEVAVDPDQADFFRRRGFTEWGRRPGWRRPGAIAGPTGDGTGVPARDELLLGWTS